MRGVCDLLRSLVENGCGLVNSAVGRFQRKMIELPLVRVLDLPLIIRFEVLRVLSTQTQPLT